METLVKSAFPYRSDLLPKLPLRDGNNIDGIAVPVLLTTSETSSKGWKRGARAGTPAGPTTFRNFL